MGLRILDCNATPSSITVTFSDAVHSSRLTPSPNTYDATHPGNYSYESPIGAVSVKLNPRRASISLDASQRVATVILSGTPLNKGDWLVLTVTPARRARAIGARGVKSSTGVAFDPGGNSFATIVNGVDPTIKPAVKAVEDAVSYPVLTEEVGYPPSPLAKPSSGMATSGAGAGITSLGQVATKAVSDVLGWKVKPDDAKGFVGALTQSFTLTEVEGHIESKWTPRTYAVQTDLAGGISGAQASIYSRAKGAVDQSLPLLDGLYKLNPEAADEDVAALKAVAASQFSELVKELGFIPPRISRVNQYFNLLLGSNAFPVTPPPIPNQPLTLSDPDQIDGTLGTLRDELGLNFTTQDFVNSVEDEQNLSNFRILSDYATSLAQSWVNNLGFFGLGTATPFFGTQLVLLSRQLSVVSESVDEVRFTLDSVFLGPAERQTMQVSFKTGDPALFLEDLLAWIQSFASEEGPRLIQDGGKFGVENTFLPVAQQLYRLVGGARDPNPANAGLPRGFHTVRVQRALEELGDELQELVNLATPIQHIVTPAPDFGLPFAVTSVDPGSVSLGSLPANKKTIDVRIRGGGFQATPTLTITPSISFRGPYFRSDSLLVATLDLSGASPGRLDVTVTNRDGTSAKLAGGFTVTP